MRIAFLIGLGLAVTAAPAMAQDLAASGPSVSVTTGTDYGWGDYGLDDDTKITVVPMSARLSTGDFGFTASLPYLRLKTPGGVVLGPDGKPITGVPTSGGTGKGFGDLSLGAKYNIPSVGLGGLELGIGGRVKLPTGNKDEGLSTGETDFAGTAEVSYPMGSFAPFLEVGYRVLGDPEDFNLRNGATMSVGSSVSFGKAVLIASYDYARSPTAESDNSHEVFAGLAVPAGNRLTFTGYGIKGFSDGSPDYGVGLLLTAKVF